MEFELVRSVEEHIRLIFQWRNDPLTRQMSYHSQPKIWDAFYSEFLKKHFCFPDLPPLFALQEGKPVAFLNFKPALHPLDRKKRCCEVNINVAPEHRGKGVGSLALEGIKSCIRGYDALYAEVKEENVVSQKAFEKAGFCKIDHASKWIEDLDKTVSIVRYLFPLKEEREGVFVIAEAGSNWRAGKQNLAFELIDAAKDAGADAVKFQVFRPETIYVKNAGVSDYLGSKEDIYEIFQHIVMPYEMIADLAEHCRQHGIEFMASTFSEQDFAAVDPFVKRHKIASYEIGHIHLLRLAAYAKKPLILSTGAASEFEIEWAVDTFKDFGGKDLTLLQCTACYPTEARSMNLKAIPWLKNRFNVKSGLSDHSGVPTTASIAAVALGAKVIEKHFTLDRTLPGPDHAFAVTPKELKSLVCGVRETEQMLGAEVKYINETEFELHAFARRGIQAIKDIQEGERFKEGDNVMLLRPGKQRIGLHARYLKEIEGKKTTRFISYGEGIQKGDYA